MQRGAGAGAGAGASTRSDGGKPGLRFDWSAEGNRASHCRSPHECANSFLRSSIQVYFQSLPCLGQSIALLRRFSQSVLCSFKTTRRPEETILFPYTIFFPLHIGQGQVQLRILLTPFDE